MNLLKQANIRDGQGRAHLHLLRPPSLAELTKCKRQAFCDTTALKSFEADVLRTETEVNEVLGDGIVVFRIYMRDELQQGILKIVGDGEGHSPVENAELAWKMK